MYFLAPLVPDPETFNSFLFTEQVLMTEEDFSFGLQKFNSKYPSRV